MAATSTSDEEMNEFEEMSLLTTLIRRRRRLWESHRGIWTKNWLLKRTNQGCFANLLPELNAEDPVKFHQFHRLDRDQFEDVWFNIAPLIKKEETKLPL